MKAWLKGGIIGSIVAVVYYFVVYLIEGLTSNCGIPLKGPMCGYGLMIANFPSVMILQIFSTKGLTQTIAINFLVPIINLFLGFIIGILIVLIIKKIKSNK